MAVFCLGQSGFKESQQSYPRVRDAYSQKWEGLNQLLQTRGLKAAELELYLLAFKEEKELEVWARNRNEEAFSKLLKLQDLSNFGCAGTQKKTRRPADS